VLWILLGLVVSVAFAIILNEITQKFVAKAYQTMMFFPYFLSWVVASYFVLAFLDPTRGLLTTFMATCTKEYK
jgi:putative aldouronate transport system permease protein